MIPRGPKYSWKKASLLIFFSTLFPLALFAFFHSIGDRPIVAIVQEPQTEKLQTSCLAELLELSVDNHLSFAHFPLKQAEQRLLETPIIAEAKLQKIRPNILYIKYTLRTPLAKLGDQANTAIDAEGHTFPIAPFYTPRPLPLLYGNGHPIFLDLIQYPVKMIDLSAIEEPTLAKRQIVLRMENDAFLRLSVRNYKKEMENYFFLEKKLDVAGKIVDLRIPNVAYIDELY